jgi:hypothetical protein
MAFSSCRDVFEPLASDNPRVTQINYNRIQLGMPTEEVYNILGDPDFWFQDMGSGQATWEGPQIEIWIEYATQRGGVLKKRIRPLPPKNLLSRLRALLGW